MRKFLILAISFFSILISTVIAQSIHSNDSEIIAFSFSSNEAIDWGKVKFKIIYKDGNEKIFDHLHGDYEFNQDASSSFVSELFPYSSDVSEIQILSGHNLKIHYFKDRRYLTSDNFPDPDIKRSFFRNLGLDVKLREDWGAPTNSLWQPYIAPHINYFVIHHTVFQNTTDDLSSAVRAIYEYHKIRCVNNSGVL
ncbi:MAG: hypothetical protein KatS3mg085_073 [Candidatus Dojkabacteria bacterium]|nr:MAG: hypothetical protein KatS3mg085_073 [Candidatus Dojkabacteria bacterium]